MRSFSARVNEDKIGNLLSDAGQPKKTKLELQAIFSNMPQAKPLCNIGSILICCFKRLGEVGRFDQAGRIDQNIKTLFIIYCI